MNATTLNAKVIPVDLKRVAVEEYENGSGWFAHSPRGGGTGTIWATAATQAEILKWAKRAGLIATVI